MERADFLVIGAGIAGASAAFELSKHGKVLVLEMERTVGYHTTGRSAAIFSVNFVSRTTEALGIATREFLYAPPDGFTESPLVTPRRSLWVARHDQSAAFEELLKEASERNYRVEQIDLREMLKLCPVLREDTVQRGLFEPDTLDLDVHGIHQGFLKGLKARGGLVILDAEVAEIRKTGGSWEVRTATGSYEAPVVVNAAGAWRDRVGTLAGCKPIGISPKRRTAFTFDAPNGSPPNGWPFIYDVDEQFYFKLENGIILASRFEEADSPPCDITPDHTDIAEAVERMQLSATLEVTHIRNKWAGLRSFVADREIVIGPDPEREGFFWVAGQGGMGIMTASAAAECLSAAVFKKPTPEFLSGRGIALEALFPARLR